MGRLFCQFSWRQLNIEHILVHFVLQTGLLHKHEELVVGDDQEDQKEKEVHRVGSKVKNAHLSH